MRGGWAVLIFAGFFGDSGDAVSGIVAAWRAKPKGQLSYGQANRDNCLSCIVVWPDFRALPERTALPLPIATAAGLRNIFRANWETRLPRPSQH